MWVKEEVRGVAVMMVGRVGGWGQVGVVGEGKESERMKGK